MRAILGGMLTVLMLAEPALAQPPAAPAKSPDKWGTSLDLEGKLGTDRNLGEGDLMVPLAQDDRNLLFGDVRMRFDDSDSHEGNFGLGVRHMLDSGWNLGAYGYFDRRRTPNDSLFNQLTFGAEALGKDWDFRANSYWPIGQTTRQIDSLNAADISGSSVIFRGGEEKALRGFDAEVGWRVPVFEVGGPLDLRLYAGGYTFDASDVPDVTGPRLRAELTGYDVPELGEGTRVTLGAEWQDDDVRGSQEFFSLRLRIPLQSEAQRSRHLTAQERRMTAPIVRDIDVVAEAGAFGAPETATQLANGNSFTVFNSATTTGAALPGAVAGAGSNVILSGTFNVANAQVAINNSQSLMAGDISVRSPSGRVATLHTPATISGINSNINGLSTVLLNSNSTLSGLTVTTAFSGGSGGHAVLIAATAGGVNILNNTITVTQSGGAIANALSFQNGNTGTVSGNTLTVTGSGGATTMTALSMSFGGTFTVTGNTLAASGGTSNIVANVNNSTFNAGSTGNVRNGGTCSGTATSGSVGFTDGTSCQ